MAHKKPKWAYALVALGAVALLAIALVVYRNPTLFRAAIDLNKEPGGGGGGGGGVSAVCGNSIREGAETCDDGDTTSGDGCSHLCRTEAGYTCAGALGHLSVCQKCGNGRKEGTETCDDGNVNTEVACAYGVATCTKCNSACSATLTLTGPVCGDGTTTAPEACDDGKIITETSCPLGTFTCSGCNNTCTQVLSLTSAVEDGSVVTLAGPVAVIVGQMARYSVSIAVPAATGVAGGWRGLSCLANLNFHKGNLAGSFTMDAEPDAEMKRWISYTPTVTGPTTMFVDCPEYVRPSNSMVVNVRTVPVCGNGVKEGGEYCDDGNITDAGTCNAGCTAFTTCGDGTRQQPNGLNVIEVCDDGNTTDVGACRATCAAFTFCGDGTVQNPNGTGVAEACDTAGASATCTASCAAVAACTVASCFTDADAAKVDDYLLGQYTPTAAELIKFDTNCPHNGITDGDSAYISDHICPQP